MMGLEGTQMKKWIVGALGIVALLVAGVVPAGGGRADETTINATKEHGMDLAHHSDEAPGAPLRMLFIHHSVGGQLLAPQGPDSSDRSIYESFPEGGGLRDRLTQAGYEVHEAAYGSRVGDRTDLFDWLPKFRDEMDLVLRVDHQDAMLPEGERHDIVAFKSCFPNNKFVGEGEAPGAPGGPELTLHNAKATMRELLPHFAEHPDVLFVYFTAPPLAPRLGSQPAWKWMAKKVLGRSFGPQELARSGALARRLNAWLAAEDGWLADYPHDNVVVFDYWNALTGDGASNLLHYTRPDSTDSHPNGEGQRRAAERFVPFLNRAVRHAGLVPGEMATVRSSAREASEGR